jgi:hypothetical protein
VNVFDDSAIHPLLSWTPSLVTRYERNGLSSVDGHVSPMCLVPRLVTLKLGTVGGCVSSGNGTVTGLVLADLLPAPSTAYAVKE